ncbi:DUF742 domain-containing protein [Streptomyces bambusae]|uniref:DUF742 domain-containing protein n=1 Tax=Streptomyces bambusae TaxID=1550616 RepID=A0ABS6ZBG5_9ACTN|nr:DUF742 domain-containing protein [Streptomyces bambusae]MBW5485066.1 DUF742 domain-containing protein [Streptomyces bambusae]
MPDDEPKPQPPLQLPSHPEPATEPGAAPEPGPKAPPPTRPRAPRRTRLYALTDGRTAAPCTALTMDTTITAAVGEDAYAGLPTEWRAVLALCRPPEGRAVAELAARMQIRLTPMTLLLGELADRGLIHHRPPLEGAETTNVHLLMRIRDNLARI